MSNSNRNLQSELSFALAQLAAWEKKVKEINEEIKVQEFRERMVAEAKDLGITVDIQAVLSPESPAKAPKMTVAKVVKNPAKKASGSQQGAKQGLGQRGKQLDLEGTIRAQLFGSKKSKLKVREWFDASGLPETSWAAYKVQFSRLVSDGKIKKIPTGQKACEYKYLSL
jgi:hypothetical protein